jgi:hypothetical protein
LNERALPGYSRFNDPLVLLNAADSPLKSDAKACLRELHYSFGSITYSGLLRIDFFLSKISVDSFDRHNPEKSKSKIITLKPNVPLEKFPITDFMLEGVVK